MTRTAGAVLVIAVLLASALLAVTIYRGTPTSEIGTASVEVGPQAVGVASASAPIDPAAGVGSVLATLDLTTNHLLAGNQQPAEQSAPQSVLFDPANGDLYVRGAEGETISVVNASTESVLSSLTVGTGGSAYIPNVPTMASDASAGTVFETNPSLETVGVIATSSNLLIASIPLGTGPGGIVLDPANGNLYTTNWYSDNVSVISGSTDTRVASIPVGGEPGAILYDPLDQEVFVSNFNTGNVSVINTTMEQVVANPRTGLASAEPLALTLDTKDDLVFVVNTLTNNVTEINGTTNAVGATDPVGSIPTSATYAPATDQLFVANGASDNLTVLQEPGNTAVANLPIGHGAQGAAYDAANGEVYVANYESNNVTIVDPSTDTLVGAVTTNNYPEALAIDSANGDVYIANEGTSNADSNLTVLYGSNSASLASIALNEYPTGLTAASNGNVYAIDYGGQDAAIIGESTNLVTGYALAASPEPTASAFDASTGDLYITSEPTGAVAVVTATGTPVATLPLGFGSYGVAYDPSNGYVYVCNYYSGNITVIDGATETVQDVFSVMPFDSLGAEIYDPADASVYVADYSAHNVTVVRGDATTASIQVGSDPSSFAYDPSNGTIFVANYGSGNISVINASTDQIVGSFSSYFPSYLAYDPQTNGLYTSSFENGQVLAYNASTYASLGGPLELQSSVRSGDIAYGAASGDLYVSNEFDSSVSILSGENVTNYPITFQETGLPAGMGWAVSLNGTSNNSLTSSIGFVAPNGTYPFVVDPVPGYVATPPTGTVTVAGAPAEKTIHFAAVQQGGSFPVTFQESGLPPTTSWTVTLNGSEESSSSAWVNFTEGNGSYGFTVGSVTGYTSAPAYGTIEVVGALVSQTIVFSPLVGSLAATLTATPGTVNVGSTSVLATTVSGGTPPYSFAYADLPSGCTSANMSSLSCVPAATGTFLVTVTVTDVLHHTATATATLTVTGPNGAPSTSSSGLSTTDWAIIIVAILVVFALFFFFVARRRKREPPAPMPPPTASPAVPPPAS